MRFDPSDHWAMDRRMDRDASREPAPRLSWAQTRAEAERELRQHAEATFDPESEIEGARS